MLICFCHACVLPCCSCSVLCSRSVFLSQKAESLEACFSSSQKQLLEATKLASRSSLWNTQHQRNSNFPRSASQARSLIFWLAALFRKYGFEAGSFVSELSAKKTSFQNALLEARSQKICCQPYFLTSRSFRERARTWDNVSSVPIEELDLRQRSDIDQLPESIEEIIEIVADHYHHPKHPLD